MKYCCKNMEYFLRNNRKEGDFDSDDIIYYAPQYDEYGIVIHDSGKSYIKMIYCPWCGKKLPDSKKDLWFDELEKIGLFNPFEEEVPEKFKSDAWWQHLIKKYSKECFGVDEYIVDVDSGWKEGFVSSDDLEQDFETLTNLFNKWLYNEKSPQESWENELYYNALCDISKAMYKIDDLKELAEYIQKIWIRRFNDKTKSFDEYIQIATNIKKVL